MESIVMGHRSSLTSSHPRSALRVLVIALLLASFAAVLPAPRAALAVAQQYRLTNLSNTQLSAQVGTTFSENVGVRVQQLSIAGNPFVNGVAITFTATTSSGGASGTFSNGTNTVTVVSSSQ